MASPAPEPIRIGPYDVVDYLRFAAAYWDFGIGGHYDIDWARQHGFERPYAQAYFLWATTIVWFQDWAARADTRSRLARIRIRFSAPIWAGDQYVVSARESDPPGRFDFEWVTVADQGGERKAFGHVDMAPAR
jgi:acyl dehydratase